MEDNQIKSKYYTGKEPVSIVPLAEYGIDGARAALEKLLLPIGGLDFVNPGETVVIKANLVSAMKPEQAATTHLLNRVMKDRNTKGVYVFVAGHYITGGAKERITEINFEDHKITVIVNVKQEG